MSYNLLTPYNIGPTAIAHPTGYQLFWYFPFNEQIGNPINHGIQPATCELVSGFSWDANSSWNKYGGLYCNGAAGCGMTIGSTANYYCTPSAVASGVYHSFYFKFNVISFQRKAYFVLFETISGNTGWAVVIDADGSMSVGIKNSASVKYGTNSFNVNGTYVAGRQYALLLRFYVDPGNIPVCYMHLTENGFFKKEAWQTWNAGDWAAGGIQTATIGNNVARNKSDRAQFYLGEVRMARGYLNGWPETFALMEPGFW